MGDNKRNLYDAIKDEYDVGSFENFSSRLEDEGARRNLYDAISGDYDVGDWNNFSSKLGYGPQGNMPLAQKSNVDAGIARWTNPAPFGQELPTGSYSQRQGPVIENAQRVREQNELSARNAMKGVTAAPQKTVTTPLKVEEPVVETGLEDMPQRVAEGDFESYRQTRPELNSERWWEGELAEARDQRLQKEYYKDAGLALKENGDLDLDAIAKDAKEKVQEYGGLRSGVYDPRDHGPVLDKEEIYKNVDDHRHAAAYEIVGNYAKMAKGLEEAQQGKASKFGAGFGNTTVKDLLSMGLSSTQDLLELKQILDRAANGEELYPEEKQALVLYGTNQQFMDALKKDSSWFSIGDGLRTSLELMAQIGLTGGTSTGVKAGTKMITEGAKAFVKKYGTKGALKLAAAEGKKIVPRFTKEGMGNYFKMLGNAALRDMGLTFYSPMTFKMVGDEMVGLYDFGEGFDDKGEYGIQAKRNDKSIANALYRAYVGSLVERFSESWGGITENAMGFWKAIGNPLGGKLIGKLSGKMGMGNLGFKKAKKALQNVGLNSIPMETAEEVLGNVVKGGLTLDKDSFKELADKDFYTQVAATSVFLGGFGGITNMAGGALYKHKIDQRRQENFQKRLDNFLNTDFDIREDGSVNEELANLQTRFVDAVKAGKFADKNGNFENGEAFQVFGEIGDYLEKTQKEWSEDKISDKEYLKRVQFATQAQDMLYDGLSNLGASEAMQEELKENIGEYRNSTDKYQNVVIVRGKDDGELYYLLDNKGDVSELRSVIGGKDAEPVTMKSDNYDLVNVMPTKDFADRTFAYGLEGQRGALEQAQQLGENSSSVEVLNNVLNGSEDANTTAEEVGEGEGQNVPTLEAPQEAAPQAEAPAFEVGQTAYLNGNPIEIRDINDEGLVMYEGEDGLPHVVEASRLTTEQTPVAEQPVAETVAEENATPAVEEAAPATPEATVEEAVQEIAQEQEEPLPLRKNGKIDFNALLEQNPSRFIVEYDRAYGAGKGTEQLLKAQESLAQQIEKAQKAVETPTDDFNKAADNEEKLQQLQAKKEAIDNALGKLEEAVDIVDEVLGQQTEAQPAAEEAAPVAEEAAPVAEEAPAETPVAEETPASPRIKLQKNLEGMSNDANFARDYDRTDRTAEEIQHLSEVLGEPGKGDGINRVYSEASRNYRGGEGAAAEAGRSTGDKERFLAQVYVGALSENLWVDDVPSLVREPLEKGQENEVYLSKDGRDVIKLSNFRLLDLGYTPEDFLLRLQAHNNSIGKDVPYTILGFAENSMGQTCIVLKQPYIRAERNATQEEIDSFLTEAGYRKATISDGNEGWTNGEYEIWDTEPRNVLVDKNGELKFIDVVVTPAGIQQAGVKIKEQRQIDEKEVVRRRAIRDAVVEKLRQAGIEVNIDEKEGQAILQAYKDLWKMSVLHGSGALFDKFDHSFMGTGEGRQAYGWGTYTTEVPGIAKNYAQASAKLNAQDQKQIDDLEKDFHRISIEMREKWREVWDLERFIEIEGKSIEAIKYLESLNDSEYEAAANEGLEGDISELNESPSPSSSNFDERLNAIAFLSHPYGKLYDSLRRGNSEIEEGDQLRSTQDFLNHLTDLQARNQKEHDTLEKEIDGLDEERTKIRSQINEIKNRKAAYLYEVEIPDDTGKNYLEYNKELSAEQKQQLKDAIREKLLSDPESGYDQSNLDKLNEDLDRAFDGYVDGQRAYSGTQQFLGFSDKEASKFLHDLGYVGIKYPAMYRSGGRKDGASNYVIFDENDAKIKSSVKLFKSKDGKTVYGFAKDGKIYLDPEAPADTPIHEYTHLWAEMFRKINPKEWKNITNLMKSTGLWDAVKKAYPELTNEEDIAEEVLAHYSGKQGLKRIEDEMKRIRGDKNMSTAQKLKALTALQNFRRAIEKFWKTIAEYLGMEFTTAEEVADRVLADLAKGINPMEVVRKVRVSDKQVKKAKEVLDYFNSKGFKDGEIVRSITDNGVSTYILGSWGLQPYTKYRISDHPTGNYRQQREISFNESTKPETLYRLGSGWRTLSGEEQQKRATGPSEYDQLWDQHKDEMKGLVFSKWQSPLGLEEALKQKAFLARAKYLQQRSNNDGTYTYEFSEPGEQTLDKRPSLEFLKAMEPVKAQKAEVKVEEKKEEKPAEEKTPVRMQKEVPAESPLKRKVGEAAKKAEAKIEEAKAVRKSKLDEMDGKIKKVNKMLVAAAQRKYDKATVKAVTDLAKELISEGLIDPRGRRNLNSLLTVIANAPGRENLNASVRRVMQIVADNQIRNQKAYRAKLLRTAATRKNQSGVKVQNKLDVFANRMLDAYNEGVGMGLEGLDESIQKAYDEFYFNPTDENKARYGGLVMAKDYLEGVKDAEQRYNAFKSEGEAKRKELYRDYKNGKISYDDYLEYSEEFKRSLLNSQMQVADAYARFNSQLFNAVGTGMLGAKAFKLREQERADEIRHMANSDMEGQSATPHRDKSKKSFFDRNVPSFFLQPISSFDMLLRQIGRKSINGEGYLWNHFLRGAIEASEKEYDGIAEAEQEMKKKVQELLGKNKDWNKMYSKSSRGTTIDAEWMEDGEMKNHTLTQGNVLAIYAWNKMEDGRMKLRAMGIDQAAIDKMMEQVDPKMKELIDWVQEEFLPKLRKKYASVYENLFGAPMDAVENYFPLRILGDAREEKVDLGKEDAFSLPSTMTGAVVKRVKNTSPLDIMNTDAFQVVADHLHEMEHWAAFAPLIKDLNTLLSYKRFRNQVKNMKTVYGSGDKLWNELKKTAEMAVGSYRPAGTKSAGDRTAVNLAKGVTAAKISFRIFTAIKQLMSMPAYIPDTNPALLAKNIGSAGKAFKWAMENLPLFRKRWKGRIAGDTRLMESEFDWGLLKSNIVEAATRFGITPNAFVDAVTVAIGAKTIYETRVNRYKKEGYSEADAEKRAKQDAEILFNETQQSAEGAFLSSMQLDRTFMAAALTVFRNASMGYQRQVVDAARNLKHMLEKGYKEQSIEFMTKQKVRDGVPEEQARKAAEKEYRRAAIHNAVRLAVFGYFLPYMWYLGGTMAYGLFGKDPEKKKEYAKDARMHAWAGFIEGLSGGSSISDLWNIVRDKDKRKQGIGYWDLPSMPVTSDIKNVISMLTRDEVQGYNELINLIVQAGIGVNPQTVTDILFAIMDEADGNFSDARERLLMVMKLAQVPQSQLRELYIDELGMYADEARKLPLETVARRYAHEQIRRNASIAAPLYSEKTRAEAEKKKATAFKKKAKDRASFKETVAQRAEEAQAPTPTTKSIDEYMEEVKKMQDLYK